MWEQMGRCCKKDGGSRHPTDKLCGRVNWFGAFRLQSAVRDGDNHEDRGSGEVGGERHLSAELANALAHAADANSGAFGLDFGDLPLRTCLYRDREPIASAWHRRSRRQCLRSRSRNGVERW